VSVTSPAPTRPSSTAAAVEPPERHFARNPNRFAPAPDSPVGRVILIEDSVDYAALVEEMLLDSFGDNLEVRHHSFVKDACAGLSGSAADCVLLDLGLPDARGLEALQQIQDTSPDLPIVVLSGHEEEQMAVEAVYQGAQDYLVKRHTDTHLLGRSIRYAIERKRSELELAHMAMHDPLTGLPNRTVFMDHLRHALARAERHDTSVAVLFLDLDRFKVINDSLGHEAGDKLLIEVAGRLAGLLRPSDTLARFGGDEFLVLCEDLDTEEQAMDIAERLSACEIEPYEVDVHELFVGLSIGIAFGSSLAEAPETIVRNADQAMYRAKQRETLYEVFEPEMHAEVLSVLEMGNELHHALDCGELRLFYQPQIDLRTGAVFGVEALLRWNHPRRGLLGPAEFVPLAEASGLIVPIGRWVISEACRQLAAWIRAGWGAGAELVMSVNLSPRQLADEDLEGAVAEALAISGIKPRSLCLEMTEGTVAADPQRTGQVLGTLKALGVSLSIDDFGTGYSSLSALGEYPIDMLKIDRSFVSGLAEGAKSRELLGAILALARALGLRSVAEGVETADQLEELRELGCEACQGFYFAPPSPPEGLRTLLGRTGARA
jgi:diguanylate cyclase (GGDEF)-like protein